MAAPTPEELKRAERLLAIERSLSDAARDQRDLLTEINRELGKNESHLSIAKKQYTSLRDISNEILRNEESETKLSKEDLDKLKSKAQTNLDYLKKSAQDLYKQKGINAEINGDMIDRLKFLNKITNEEEALLRAADEGFGIEEETLRLIDARIKRTENLNKATGATGDFLRISEHLLDKIGAKNLQKPFEAARKAAEAKAKALGVTENKTAGIGDKFKVLGSSIAGFGEGLLKAFTDPLAIVTSIGAIIGYVIKTVLELDEQMTKFAKNLNISKDAAHELEANFDEASYNVDQYSKNLTPGTFSIHAQVEAVGQLNEALGTSELFTTKMLAGQVLLTKRLGLNNEEAAEFAKFSMLVGKSQEDITTEIGDQIVAFKKETGVQLNLKKVSQDITKIHGQLSANLGNDPKKIAAAVMQAQKLGLSLEKTRDIANSLLDFESSIQNELEAELLTGKGLNLERARELALRGKTTEAAAELMNQVGGLSEFQSLNVLQQNALAKSVGLTADEMANAFKEQELLKGTAFQTKEALSEQYKLAEKQGKLEEFQRTVRQAANGEQLLKMAAQQSIQEKFQETIEKLKETLNRILAGPLLGMIDKFADFISKGENLKIVFQKIKGIVEGIKEAFEIISTLLKMAYYTSGIGLLIEGYKLISGGNETESPSPEPIKKTGDAAISPTGGLMISGPKGSFITDPADEIVAAPGASKMLGGGGSGITKADLDAIANRPIMVSVQANTDTLLRLQTAQTQYGAPNSFA